MVHGTTTGTALHLIHAIGTLATIKMSSYLNEEKSVSPADLNLFVEDLIEQMQARFTDMGHSILGRMDDMGTRMDELEQSIASLLQQAGLDQNEFSNNSSIDTTSSFPAQVKANSLRVTTTAPNNSGNVKTNDQNKMQSASVVPVVSAYASPTTSIQTPISTTNDTNLTPLHSQDKPSTQQNYSATPSRARVTIEI